MDTLYQYDIYNDADISSQHDNEAKQNEKPIERNYDMQKQYDLILFYFGQREIFLFHGYIRHIQNHMYQIIPNDIYLLCYQYRLIFPYYSNHYDQLSYTSLIPKNEPYIIEYYLQKINSSHTNQSIKNDDINKWTFLFYHRLNQYRRTEYERKTLKRQTYYYFNSINWAYSYGDIIPYINDEMLQKCIGFIHKFISDAKKLQNDIHYVNNEEIYKSFELTFTDLPESVLKHFVSEITYELFQNIAKFYIGKSFKEWMKLYEIYFSFRLLEIEQQQICILNIMKQNPVLKDVYIQRQIKMPTEITANVLDIKLFEIQKHITNYCDNNGLYAMDHFIEIIRHKLLAPKIKTLTIFYEDKFSEIKKEYLFYVPMQINKKNENEGRIGIELFDDVCPLICYQFRLLTNKKHIQKNGNYVFKINSMKVEQFVEFCCVDKKQKHCLFPNGFQCYTDIHEKGRQSELGLVLLNVKENINVFKSFVITLCKFCKLKSLNKSEYIIIGRIKSGLHHLSYIESLKRYSNGIKKILEDYTLTICKEGTPLKRN
eukprot:438331_1